MAASWEREAGEALRWAQALLAPPWLPTIERALVSFERLDPSALWDEMLRATLAGSAPPRESARAAGGEVWFAPRTSAPQPPDGEASTGASSRPQARTHHGASRGQAAAGHAEAQAQVHPAVAPGPAAGPAAPASPGGAPAPGARLISGLSALQSLFDSEVAHSQSRARGPSNADGPAEQRRSASGLASPTRAARARSDRAQASAADGAGAADPAPEGAGGLDPASAPPALVPHLDLTAAPRAAAAPGPPRGDHPSRGAVDGAIDQAPAIEPAEPTPPWPGHGSAPSLAATSRALPAPAPSAAREPQAGAVPTRPAAAPDPTWEAVLFDRLIDRLQAHLREQAIRHLGFTGGLP